MPVIHTQQLPPHDDRWDSFIRVTTARKAVSELSCCEVRYQHGRHCTPETDTFHYDLPLISKQQQRRDPSLSSWTTKILTSISLVR